MKVEDLMVGDWVNVFDVPKQIEGIRKFKNGDEIVYYDGDNGNFITSVTPIPITPEYLEKNGFSSKPNKEHTYDYYVYENLSISRHFWNDEDNWIVVADAGYESAGL